MTRVRSSSGAAGGTSSQGAAGRLEVGRSAASSVLQSFPYWSSDVDLYVTVPILAVLGAGESITPYLYWEGPPALPDGAQLYDALFELTSLDGANHLRLGVFGGAFDTYASSDGILWDFTFPSTSGSDLTLDVAKHTVTSTDGGTYVGYVSINLRRPSE